MEKQRGVFTCRRPNRSATSPACGPLFPERTACRRAACWGPPAPPGWRREETVVRKPTSKRREISIQSQLNLHPDTHVNITVYVAFLFLLPVRKRLRCWRHDVIFTVKQTQRWHITDTDWRPGSAACWIKRARSLSLSLWTWILWCFIYLCS